MIEGFGGMTFVKWVGGKGALLNQLHMPSTDGVYHEPFVGGGALFFARRPTRASISDVNPQLIAVYRAIRSPWRLGELIAHLSRLEDGHSVERYYDVRAAYNASGDVCDPLRCAQFIYLNKTCFNGLHRVNKRGEFNVPAGRYAKPRILDEASLEAAHRVLQGINIRCAGYEYVLETARAGDTVYLDPPYDVEDGAKGFTSYSTGTFGPREQDEVAAVFRELDARGCLVMASNSFTRANLARYAGWNVQVIQAARSINSKATGRAKVPEIVVRNYAGVANDISGSERVIGTARVRDDASGRSRRRSAANG